MAAMLLVVHSLLRWVVLLAHLGRAGKGLAGWFGGGKWGGADKGLGLAALISTDLQLLVGLGLYFGLSPAVKAGMADPGAAMKDPVLRFWLVEHATTMILAVVVAHIGHVLAKRAKTDAARFKAAAIGSIVVLVLLAAGIPWPFREGIGRALFPG